MMLRLGFAIRLTLEGSSRLAGIDTARDHAGIVLTVVAGLTLIVLGILVGVGLMTSVVQISIASLLLFVFVTHLRAAGSAALATRESWYPLLDALIAGGAALLGPGKYSVDAYLFGRHEIVIAPPAKLSAD
jgi:uncharacterized membrane protein YphA (DoxX/SURF4 family)